MKKSFVISSPCHLSIRDEQLVITRKDPPDTFTRFIEDIGILVLENQQITITLPVLQQLARHNVTMVVCDKNHLPISMSWPMDVHHTHGLRVRQQLESSEPLRKNLWKQTIEAKILNQAEALASLGLESGPLRTWAKEVQSGDATHREGISARYYFQTMYGKDWNRHPEGEPPNQWLNYAYTLIRASMSRALTGAGLLPVVGIQHQNKYNSYPLADDIMEPYRPFADLQVYGMYRQYGGEMTDINTYQKQTLFQILTADTLYRGQKSPLQVSMENVAANLAQCYAGVTRKLDYPKVIYAPACQI